MAEKPALEEAYIAGVDVKRRFRRFLIWEAYRVPLREGQYLVPVRRGLCRLFQNGAPKTLWDNGDIACSADGKTLELSDHCFSHTRYLFHWKRLKEGGQFIWVKDAEPIRFVQIGSYLGKKLDGGQPDGTGQSSGYFLHFAFDAPGHVFHRAKEPFQPRRVKIGFIDGRFFDSGRIRAQDINDGSGNPA